MTSYKKLILRNTLFICLLFSLLFTVSFYVERYFSSKKEYLANAQQNLRDIMDKMNASSLQVQDLPIIFLSNPDFEEYIESTYTPSSLNYTIAMYLRLTISTLSTTKGLIAVTRQDDDVIITNNSLMSTDYFFSDFGLPGEYIEELLNSAKDNNSAKPYSFFTTANGKSYFTVLLLESSQFPRPYLVFNVCEFEKFLGVLDKDAYILISDSQNKPIYRSKGLSLDYAEKILNGKKVFKYNTVASATKTFQSLGTLNFSIILPRTKYISDINHHIIFTLLSFLVLFLLSIILSQKVSERTYSPVQQLMSQISSLDEKTLENEFEAISSFISIMKNRNTNLTDIIADSKNELKKKFIDDLLHGHLTDEQMSEGINAYLRDSDAILPLALIITECNREIAATAAENGENASSLNLVIASLFRGEFEKSGFFHFTALSPTCFCAIISCDDTEAARARLQKLLLSIESELGFNMFASVSEYIEKWEDLPGAFLTAYFAHTTLKSQDISQKVYSHSEIDNPVLYSYKIDNEIFSFCLRGEREQLKASLDFLFEENFRAEEDFIKRSPQISVLIFALCTRILASVNTDSETVFGKDYNIYLELRSCADSKEFRGLLEYIFMKITDHIEYAKSADKQDYLNDMIKYIYENYSSNISLSDLAKYMNMSLSYVSKLFKRLSDSNFKDYLAKVRTDESKKLLTEHPEMSIHEISSKVGFYTATTYSNVFAKLNGMTPSEYRRTHRK